MKQTETVDQYMNRVLATVNQLKTHGEDMTDQKVIEKVLRTLTRKFIPVVAAIEESKDLTCLTVDELTGSLLSHESRLDRAESSSLESAFQTQVSINRGKGRGRRGRSRGRGRQDYNFSRGEGRSAPNQELDCDQPQYQKGRGR